MCYNYDNFVPGFEPGQLVNKYKLRIGDHKERWEQFKERFHFFYTTGFAHEELPVITMQKPDEIQLFHWGLIPHWVKSKEQADTLKKQTLNARSETVFELASFKAYIKSRRCLIPATGFFEWKDINKQKYPYHIIVKDDSAPKTVRPFCFGGIYSQWIDKDSGEAIDTFSIITTPANPLMEAIHNTKKRMPLILSEADESEWLDASLNEVEIKELMKPYPNELMCAYTISKRITSRDLPRNTVELIEPFAYEGVEDWLNVNN